MPETIYEKHMRRIEERKRLLEQRAEEEAQERALKEQARLEKAAARQGRWAEKTQARLKAKVVKAQQQAEIAFYWECAGRMYNRWRGMMSRCFDKQDKAYANYGGRGITDCPRWCTFHNFWSDMRVPPHLTSSLGRIDNDKGYSPDNVRWESATQQAGNRRVRRDSRSGVRGVGWDATRGCWVAEGTREGIRTKLYRGPSFEEACAARARWEQESVSSS